MISSTTCSIGCFSTWGTSTTFSTIWTSGISWTISSRIQWAESNEQRWDKQKMIKKQKRLCLKGLVQKLRHISFLSCTSHFHLATQNLILKSLMARNLGSQVLEVTLLSKSLHPLQILHLDVRHFNDLLMHITLEHQNHKVSAGG